MAPRRSDKKRRGGSRHVHGGAERSSAATQLVYGVHPVRECLNTLGEQLARAGGTRLLVARQDALADELVALAAEQGLPGERIEQVTLDELVGDANHQGVALFLGPFPYVELEDVIAGARGTENPRVLVLDQVQDPHNLGALLRSAAAFGLHGVVLPRDRSASVTPAVIRVSAGGAFHVPVARVTNLARTLDALREAGFWLYGADASEEAVEAASIDWRGAAALVLGAEGRGLRRLTRERCDALVRIPISPAIDSLNVSVAAGILMYEASRPRPGT